MLADHEQIGFAAAAIESLADCVEAVEKRLEAAEREEIFIEQAAKEPRPIEDTPQEVLDLAEKVRELGEAGLREAYKETVKQTRQEKISAAKQAVIEQLSEDEQALAGEVRSR